MPPFSFESPFLIRIFLVSAFLPDVTQQIHSLRASGVMSSHTAFAAGVRMRAFCQSSGIVCTVPPARSFCIMSIILPPIEVIGYCTIFIKTTYRTWHHELLAIKYNQPMDAKDDTKSGTCASCSHEHKEADGSCSCGCKATK